MQDKEGLRGEGWGVEGGGGQGKGQTGGCDGFAFVG
jgi:hypothetical protein